MPRATNPTMLFYTYILQSVKDRKRYIGFTHNLTQRIKEHQSGKVTSTKSRLPMKFIYCEVCTNKEDALRREQYLKSTKGMRFLVKRLKVYYQSDL